MPPFLIGLMAAGVVVCAAVAFCAIARRRFVAEAQQALQQAKSDGTLPPELQQVDMENMPLADVGLRVSRLTFRMVSIAHCLADFAIILIPVVIATCVALAVLLGRMI